MPARTLSKDRRRGNVFLESALVSLVFFAIVLGIFDFGQFLYTHQALVQRARNAVRTGAINGETTTQIQNRILYDATSGSGTGYFGLTTSNVSVAKTGTGTDDAQIKVTITDFPFKMISLYIAGSRTASSSISVTIPLGMFD